MCTATGCGNFIWTRTCRVLENFKQLFRSIIYVVSPDIKHSFRFCAELTESIVCPGKKNPQATFCWHIFSAVIATRREWWRFFCCRRLACHLRRRRCFSWFVSSDSFPCACTMVRLLIIAASTLTVKFKTNQTSDRDLGTQKRQLPFVIRFNLLCCNQKREEGSRGQSREGIASCTCVRWIHSERVCLFR